MPSTSRGQNVDAASANANVTELATGMRSADSARMSGTSTPPTAATCRPTMFDITPRRLSACPTTPAMDIVRPEDVERNAANAPAVRSADSSSPALPPSMRAGSSSTTASARPSAMRSLA